jgi:hypothetical protein
MDLCRSAFEWLCHKADISAATAHDCMRTSDGRQKETFFLEACSFLGRTMLEGVPVCLATA